MKLLCTCTDVALTSQYFMSEPDCYICSCLSILQQETCNDELDSYIDIKIKDNGGHLTVQVGSLEPHRPCVDGAVLH